MLKLTSLMIILTGCVHTLPDVPEIRMCPTTIVVKVKGKFSELDRKYVNMLQESNKCKEDFGRSPCLSKITIYPNQHMHIQCHPYIDLDGFILIEVDKPEDSYR